MDMRFERLDQGHHWIVVTRFDGEDGLLPDDSYVMVSAQPGVSSIARWHGNLESCARWIGHHAKSASFAWEEMKRLFPEHAELIDEMVLDLAKRAILHV
jgi:hypothetical protein